MNIVFFFSQKLLVNTQQNTIYEEFFYPFSVNFHHNLSTDKITALHIIAKEQS